MVVFGRSYVTVVSIDHSAIQRLVGDEIRGRVVSLWLMTFGICFPVGVLAEGAVPEPIAVQGALGAVAALLAIVLAFVTARRLLPRIDPQLSAAPVPR